MAQFCLYFVLQWNGRNVLAIPKQNSSIPNGNICFLTFCKLMKMPRLFEEKLSGTVLTNEQR